MRSLARSTVFVAVVFALSAGCGGGAPPPKTAASQGTPGAPGDPNAPAQADPLEGWEKIRDEDGITVHRKEVEGSPVVAFRGEGDIDAPIGRVALVQMDLEHNNEWIDKLVVARVLDVKSDAEYVTYSHIGAPFVVSDRDFVNAVQIDFAAPTRVKFNLHSVEDPKAPPTAGVRGKLLHSSFELTAVSAEKTHLVCEIHADPMGSLPKWLVNQFQKGWAFKTISQLRKQSQKAGIVERAPKLKALLERQGFTQF